MRLETVTCDRVNPPCPVRHWFTGMGSNRRSQSRQQAGSGRVQRWHLAGLPPVATRTRQSVPAARALQPHIGTVDLCACAFERSYFRSGPLDNRPAWLFAFTARGELREVGGQSGTVSSLINVDDLAVSIPKHANDIMIGRQCSAAACNGTIRTAVQKLRAVR
jgi:hypothetical protein